MGRKSKRSIASHARYAKAKARDVINSDKALIFGPELPEIDDDEISRNLASHDSTLPTTGDNARDYDLDDYLSCDDTIEFDECTESVNFSHVPKPLTAFGEERYNYPYN